MFNIINVILSNENNFDCEFKNLKYALKEID